jgi:hypothetical protein
MSPEVTSFSIRVAIAREERFFVTVAYAWVATLHMLV